MSNESWFAIGECQTKINRLIDIPIMRFTILAWALTISGVMLPHVILLPHASPTLLPLRH
jgi:hypothetical protein